MSRKTSSSPYTCIPPSRTILHHALNWQSLAFYAASPECTSNTHWEKNDVSEAQKSMKSLKKLQYSFVFLVDSIAKETSRFVEHRNLGMCNIHNLGNMF